ncbi:methyl-accepting chemotaxis protein [Dictyobacter arantiisoli]|uniref:Methyl-accepting transducer domain-containing protein n=1 Tax=Dictyobacter arantiisoli TaxID=2014874 RepID=A0A5A5TCK8_9CHLR|nr:methyl-accepting chemotaxis protein [Dictyobacter arantiisoli]GCF09077.1 hypothetical protein KDI_26410 [Dictyobacter arantiisoli]
MSERKPQSNHSAVRVFIKRPVNDYFLRREVASNVSVSQEDAEAEKNNQQPGSNSPVSTVKDSHVQQVKELVRLCGVLRADLSLDEVLQQIVNSTAACTGFKLVCINLLDQSGSMLHAAAATGLPAELWRKLRENPNSLSVILNMLRPEFRISQSFFIPHGHEDELAEVSFVTVRSSEGKVYRPGQWHPEDVLIIPLYWSNKQEMIGCISLDDPADGLVPTEDTIEMAELFASKAAIAIENARKFQEREAERLALEDGIAVLSKDIALLAQGDMQVRITSQHPRLQPITTALNSTIDQISTILYEMQTMTQVVDEHMQNVQRNTELLFQDTHQQELQVHQISRTIEDFAQRMHTISKQAANLSKTAIDGVDVTREAQTTVDRTVEGMGIVRDATLQSARMMKKLSESGQEINETVLVMNDLTMRMHLLALNAAIEATRAGEHGRGFTVIAQEVRALATSSTEAARKVGEYIRTIQQETTKASQGVEQSTQEVVKQTELVMQTGVALDAVGIVTDQLTQLIDGICSTAGNQMQGSQLVVTAISEILRMTGDVTRHMHDMQQSTNSLVEISNTLRSRLSSLHLRGA